jgi:hypothetical protein
MNRFGLLCTATALVLASASSQGADPLLDSLSDHGFVAPAVFIENCGQWPATALFHGRVGGSSVWVEQGAIVVQSPEARSPSSVRLVFEGASAIAEVMGEAGYPGIYNYFSGDEPSKWVRGATSFGRVRFRGLYPGIELVLRTEASTGRLKYDIHVAPGADLSRVVVRCEGILGLRLDSEGALVIESMAGPLFHAPGRSWQVSRTGEERDTACEVVLLGGDRFGFVAPDRNADLPLVIDPGLVWSTYLGSPSNYGVGDLGFAVALAPNGDVIAVGGADWFDFPTTPGSYQHPAFAFTAHDIFVTRFRGSDGALLYSSIIGGPDVDRAHAVVTDAEGRAYVAGEARRGFPTTPGAFDTHQDAVNGSGFLLRMSTIGDLEYSTFVEGTQPFDWFLPYGIALDSSTGSVVLAGQANGTGHLVTPGAFDTSPSFAGDGYVIRLDMDGGSVQWATYLGGNGVDELWAVAVDHDGRVAVTGATKSSDFPTTPGVVQPSIGNPQVSRSTFVTVFAPVGDQLVWSSYLGGTSVQEVSAGTGIAFDEQGGIVVVGQVKANGFGDFTFPVTTGAFQTVYAGESDGFVSRFTPSGASLVYSTLLGGPGFDRIVDVAVDGSGIVTVTGTAEPGLPVSRGAFDTTWGGVHDGLIARFDPRGRKLLYSTYFGGNGAENTEKLALYPNGRVVISGTTTSTAGFPTTPNVIGPNFQGGQSDAFVSVLDLVLDGTRLFGTSTPACKGPLQLNATVYPKAELSSFGFYLSQAPASSTGWLLVGTAASAPTQLLGVAFFLDRGQPIDRVPLQTTDEGYVEIPWSLVQSPPGTTFAAQAIVRTTAGCAGQGEWSASNAIGVKVQW